MNSMSMNQLSLIPSSTGGGFILPQSESTKSESNSSDVESQRLLTTYSKREDDLSYGSLGGGERDVEEQENNNANPPPTLQGSALFKGHDKIINMMPKDGGLLHLGDKTYVVKPIGFDDGRDVEMNMMGSSISADKKDGKKWGETKTKDNEMERLEGIIRKYEEDSRMNKRFITMLEVVISKLFPAGFGWQFAATVSKLDPNTTKFAITTGIAEATAVFTGHVIYSLYKSKGQGAVEILQTGLLLSTGTICSGTSWQPVVNFFQQMNLSFLGVFIGTWIFCTHAFHFGLRVARNLYSKRLSYVEGPTFENARTDFALSFTIGAATAFFVGTDVSYHPDENFLLKIVGINDSFSLLYGSFLAGCSTALGFTFAQVIFNVVYPVDTCWID